MIKLNTTSLKIPSSLLEEKYEGQYKIALENIKNQRRGKEIGFFDVDETVDVEKIEKFVAKKIKDQKFENLVVLGVGGSAL